ncbi:MAG: hypothetical protein AUG74_10795 [Bacteroidetes bacterium 13_1_20CM_4_60_6]|nr:MAG: hypothetical protein AUG74_10795 [Bacteroidetes bacterium 13_1_20CM_4_60_6]
MLPDKPTPEMENIFKEIEELEAGDLFQLLSNITDKIEKIDAENPTGPDETDPRIEWLLAVSRKVQDRLDPLVREKYRDDPATLAEWDEIMHMCDDLPKDDAEGAELSSSEKK